MAYKILMIDDDTELLKMLKKFLEIKKYEIITAGNGLEGLNKIKLQPDIILLDVNMPNIDGIEVCRRIRDKVACPILFLTARVDEQDVINGFSSGGDDYILKPFSLKELDARITAHLKREARRREKTECCFQGELSIAGSCAAVFLFYQNKLRKPMEELVQASKRIAENHLDFCISYENKDEMGELCREFEKMREQLARNNQALWRTVEEEKMLRAAIAHDIRAPLSVLKGYQEMLTEYLPSEDINMEQAMEMLSESRRQIERMDAFVETMRKLSSLENRQLTPENISARQLEKDIQGELAILEKEYGKQCMLQVSESKEEFYGDKEIILEVAENLLSNALRHGKRQIIIMVKAGYEKLSICVMDDGDGFREDAEKITEAFYGQNVKDSLKHAGLGMYISRLYCEKHGGKLVLGNDEQRGAVVTAIFCRIA